MIDEIIQPGPIAARPAVPEVQPVVVQARSWLDRVGPWLILIVLCGGHAVVITAAFGGWAGLTSDWPPLQADYGLHYPHGLATREFLRTTGFAAGYDPSFMAGFPMSVISGTSSTWSNTAIFLFGGDRPAVAFKVAVWFSVVLAPILVGWASCWLGGRVTGAAWSIFLYLIYFWTDFPHHYVALGMFSYALAIPLGLVAIAALVRYLEVGGWLAWTGAACLGSVLLFTNLTSMVVVAPAALMADGVAWWSGRRGARPIPVARHAGLWLLAVPILAVNAFWWLPAIWLRSTVGETRFAFFHREPVLGRLAEIFTREAPIEAVLLGIGVPGLVLLGRTRRVAAVALAGLVGSGFAWGYLAGAIRGLDGLQPGRQTYACYAGLCVAAGAVIAEVSARARMSGPGRFDRWVLIGLVVISARLFAPSVDASVRGWAFQAEPVLSSRPLPILTHLIAVIQQSCQPGDRLLFEESGLAIRGESDPFEGRHLSPILPARTGVEVLGGPYLHTPVTTNFTQFGEGMLFGEADWGRDQFIRYARLYRPAAIACWTRKARSFCRANPDLVQVLDENDALLFGRVLGFEGAAIEGSARVEAGPNRLLIRDPIPGAGGRLVLRYHAAPCLVADPPLTIEPVYLEGDPVPFIGLHPTSSEPITIRMRLPPVSGWFRSAALPARP